MARSRDGGARSVSSRPLGVPAGPDPDRRRDLRTSGAALEAAVALLDDPAVGLAGITMAAVARRSGVSKATLYRWWPDKSHLVVDAYRAKATRDLDAAVTGDVRSDLMVHVGHMAYALAALDSAGSVTAITLAAAQDPAFGALYRETLLRERRRGLLDVLETGRTRGQVRASVDLEVVVDAIYGAVHHRLLLNRTPIDGPFVTALVDLVLSGIRP